MQASSLSVNIKKSEVLKDEGSLPASKTKNHFPSRDIAPLILLIPGFVGLGFHSVAQAGSHWGIPASASQALGL